MTSQDAGAMGGSGLIVVTRPAGGELVGSLGWCLACTARGSRATGQGSGVLHRGGVLAQYTHPLISTPPQSCSRPTRGGVRAGAGVESVPSGPCAGARRGQAGTDRAEPGRGCQNPAARTLDSITREARCPRSGRQPSPLSMRSEGIPGVLWSFLCLRRLCGVEVRCVDTYDLPVRPAKPLSSDRRLRTTSPIPGSRSSERLRSHDTRMSQK